MALNILFLFYMEKISTKPPSSKVSSLQSLLRRQEVSAPDIYFVMKYYSLMYRCFSFRMLIECVKRRHLTLHGIKKQWQASITWAASSSFTSLPVPSRMVMWVCSCMLDLFIFYVLCSSACQLQLMHFIIMAERKKERKKKTLTIGRR